MSVSGWRRILREPKATAIAGALLAGWGPPEALLPAELLPAAYSDVKPELYPLAERSLLAHLGKLVKEGRARVDERGRYTAS